MGTPQGREGKRLAEKIAEGELFRQAGKGIHQAPPAAVCHAAPKSHCRAANPGIYQRLCRGQQVLYQQRRRAPEGDLCISLYGRADRA